MNEASFMLLFYSCNGEFCVEGDDDDDESKPSTSRGSFRSSRAMDDIDDNEGQTPPPSHLSLPSRPLIASLPPCRVLSPWLTSIGVLRMAEFC